MKNGASPGFPAWAGLALRDLAEMARELEESPATAPPPLAAYYRQLSVRLWLVFHHLTQGEWGYSAEEWGYPSEERE